jgi:CelD/BcsL family acetyltransferase involved in cellulose biosynthesis
MPTADSASQVDPGEIRSVNPLEMPGWDRALADLPGAGFFHSRAWAGVLHDTYGYQTEYQARFESGRLCALLPMMEVNSWLTGRRGMGLPFTDLVEPLCPDAGSFQQLYQAVLALGRARRWKFVECRGGKKWLPDAPASTSFLRHVLPLGAGETALLSGFEDSVRRAIRKAERGALKIEFAKSPEAMQEFYRLMCLTRRRHGVPPQPYPFFANIQRHALASGHGWIVLARHAGQPVAGAVFLHFGRQAIYKFGASDESHQQLRSNNLVMWRAILHYASEGFTALDFGRTSLGNEGLRKFKLGWGVQEQPADYTRYDFRTSSYVTARDEAQGWHNRVFQALPLPMSRLAGSLLYRHIA